MPRHLVRMFAFTLVAGCSSPDIQPKAGTWTYNDVVEVESTCAGMTQIPDGKFTITVLSEDRLTIEADPLGNPLDCSYDGGELSCPETLLLKIKSGMDDAELVLTVAIDGTFHSATEFAATEVLRQSCTGTDCEDVIAANKLTLPCITELTFTGRSE